MNIFFIPILFLTPNFLFQAPALPQALYRVSQNNWNIEGKYRNRTNKSFSSH